MEIVFPRVIIVQLVPINVFKSSDICKINKHKCQIVVIIASHNGETWKDLWQAKVGLSCKINAHNSED